MENKIGAMLANEEFVEELRKAETIDQAVALFSKEGVTVTTEELNAYLSDERDDDLTEDDLNDVSGGCVFSIGIRIIRGIINSCNRSSGGGGQGSFGGGGGGGGGR